MPLYEYRCPQCGRLFTKLQAVGASEADTMCPSCNHRGATRQVSAVASVSGKADSTRSTAQGPAPSCSGFS
jgi:putative FmdB family regulatory protein